MKGTKNKELKISSTTGVVMDEKELKQIYGSGNSQVRYIPNEYIQAKILSEKRFNLNG